MLQPAFWRQVQTSDRTHHGSVLSLSDLLLVHRLHHHLLLLLLLEEGLLLLKLKGLLHSLLVLRTVVKRLKNSEPFAAKVWVK